MLSAITSDSMIMEKVIKLLTFSIVIPLIFFIFKFRKSKKDNKDLEERNKNLREQIMNLTEQSQNLEEQFEKLNSEDEARHQELKEF